LIGLSRLVPSVKSRGPIVRAEATKVGIVIGAMAGALSHPLLDGIMHSDIEPFQPWTAANPLLGLVDVAALHRGCALAGLLGIALLALGYRRTSR